MAETWVLLSAFLFLAAVWLLVRGGSPGLAQAPTPASTLITPAVSTASPSQVVVSPVTNVAVSTTGPLTGESDDDSWIGTGAIAGVAAAGAVLFGGIAYRLARGRPRRG